MTRSDLTALRENARRGAQAAGPSPSRCLLVVPRGRSGRGRKPRQIQTIVRPAARRPTRQTERPRERVAGDFVRSRSEMGQANVPSTGVPFASSTTESRCRVLMWSLLVCGEDSRVGPCGRRGRSTLFLQSARNGTPSNPSVLGLQRKRRSKGPRSQPTSDRKLLSRLPLGAREIFDQGKKHLFVVTN